MKIFKHIYDNPLKHDGTPKDNEILLIDREKLLMLTLNVFVL